VSTKQQQGSDEGRGSKAAPVGEDVVVAERSEAQASAGRKDTQQHIRMLYTIPGQTARDTGKVSSDASPPC